MITLKQGDKIIVVSKKHKMRATVRGFRKGCGVIVAELPTAVYEIPYTNRSFYGVGYSKGEQLLYLTKKWHCIPARIMEKIRSFFPRWVDKII